MQPLHGNETGFIASIRQETATNSCNIRSLKAGFKVEVPVAAVSLRVDSQGRWISFRDETGFYRRCMNGCVVMGHCEKWLSDESYAELLDRIHSVVQKVIRQEALDDALQLILEQALKQDVCFYRQ
ncbi:MAG: hypothetical protein ACR2PX_18660 [Endozoicomonas sp.]|uniref:hypothetical protein n=1 Tax=Endozoicomonas sp. TaxID=1892382 RepID=UPI003D9B986F